MGSGKRAYSLYHKQNPVSSVIFLIFNGLQKELRNARKCSGMLANAPIAKTKPFGGKRYAEYDGPHPPVRGGLQHDRRGRQDRRRRLRGQGFADAFISAGRAAAVLSGALRAAGRHDRHGAAGDGFLAGGGAVREAGGAVSDQKDRDRPHHLRLPARKEPLLDVREDAPRRAQRRAAFAWLQQDRPRPPL